MATAAQIEANRLNAQKSTGPRTAEGKEKVAQNALKHGLFAQEGAIRGEDELAFERHRVDLLDQLAPGSPLEEILTERIVDLTWRLRRAAQSQTETFTALYAQFAAEEAQAEEPGDGATTLGRMLLADFSEAGVLDRLQRHERRIEGGFYRALYELRRVFDQRKKAIEECPAMLDYWREDVREARQAKLFGLFAPEQIAPPAAGGTMNTPGPEVAPAADRPSWQDAGPASAPPPGDESCGTKPIGAASLGVAPDTGPSWPCDTGGPPVPLMGGTPMLRNSAEQTQLGPTEKKGKSLRRKELRAIWCPVSSKKQTQFPGLVQKLPRPGNPGWGPPTR